MIGKSLFVLGRCSVLYGGLQGGLLGFCLFLCPVLQTFRLAVGADISAKVLNIKTGFAAAFSNPLPSFHTQDLLVGVIGAVIIFLALRVKRANAKKYRKGIEYGSARCGA